ncbi:hypothetical protein THRCLA_21249 [Thraustotheca clavata]|uniref:Uncharacterized protein n=1 Tax=Thraustotheca clavata TaxID=74557 RepID=A0A1V9ZYG5_9STRA|nr:hypothetical protein THRCLA_21249 [Thraustotheca clavata]
MNGCKFVKLAKPIKALAVGGHVMVCKAKVIVDIEISTAAGKVHLRDVECLVLEANESEFLLGNRTMSAMGIDIDQFGAHNFS